MAPIIELVDSYPSSEAIIRVERNDKLKHAKPNPLAASLMRDYDPITALHFDTVFTPGKFAPPRDIYKGEHARMEWQKMSGRQPFYHRNCDVDEISLHLSGKRTFLSERGSIRLNEGDFLRIPVFTAHDNFGVEDVHLIFYLRCPARQCVPGSRKAGYLETPYEGWTASPVSEVVTECLGAVGCDIAHQMVDENLIVHRRKQEGEEQIEVVSIYGGTDDGDDTMWIYKSDYAWLGSTRLNPQSPRERKYRRHRCGHEVQFQVQGCRTLITQRGSLFLEPGDVVNIPLGTAFTSHVERGECTYVSLLTTAPLEAQSEATKKAI